MEACMNLNLLNYFLITAEEESITHAATRLHISQQALSSYIRRLEEEYGVTLFERKPLFRLSKAGEQMVIYSKQLLETEKNMRSEFSDISRNSRATLRIGISRLRTAAFFPLIWKLYHDSHPNISIDILDGNSQSFSELLSVGKLDLYIGIDVPKAFNQHKILLSKDRMHCGFSIFLLKFYYPEAWSELIQDFKKHGVSLPAIQKLPFAALREGNRLRSTVDHALPRDLNLRYILECNQQDMIYEISRQGYAAGLISPVTLYRHHLDNITSDFFAYPLDSSIPESSCFLVYRSDYRLPSYVNAFIQDACMVFRSYERSIKKHFF